MIRVLLPCLVLSCAVAASVAGAQAPSPIAVERYLDALARQKLLDARPAGIRELQALVRRAEALQAEERHEDAVVVLYEAVESPAHADYDHTAEYRAAEYMLGSALYELGALDTAAAYLDRVIARGAGDPLHGPAVRRRVDTALARGRLAEAVAALAAADLSEDTRNELRYLRGRERYDAGDFPAAVKQFAAITERSRFHASAHYLRGAIAARAGKMPEAETHFCRVAGRSDRDPFAFHVDRRYFEVKDLARLGLGRITHEVGRNDDAFYYYFQVPGDSPRVSEAMFEAAHAMYEGGDFDTSLDLLDQLQARAPRSPFVDEASILRGYVALARCDFERADREFERFIKRFRPVLAQVDRLIDNPSRRELLYEQVREGRGGDTRTHDTRRMILALLQVDPEFYRLHRDVTVLDAEVARAGRVHDTLDVIAARVEGSDRPRTGSDPDPVRALLDAIEIEVDDARLALRTLNEETDALRRVAADRPAIRELERQSVALARRLEAVRDGLFEQRTTGAAPAPSAGGDDLQAALSADLAFTRSLPARAARVRAELVAAADARALTALTELRGRVADGLHRARIGKIDAVMGSKRRIELQIESLAAGRFPAELRDPLLVQGLLSDDEEYWPFEGEEWPDEYDERYAPESPP